MFEIVACGYIADELPHDLMVKFLAAVNRTEGEVFFGKQDQAVNNQS